MEFKEKEKQSIHRFIKRVLPDHHNQITIEKTMAASGRDIYEISGTKGNILLRANSVNSAAALGQYLKYDAKVNLSWCGSRMELPGSLPAPRAYHREIEQKYRVYFNCG